MIKETEKISLRKAVPRLLQIMLVLAGHKFLRSLFGKKNLPPPKEVREAFIGISGIIISSIGALFRDRGQHDMKIKTFKP